MKIIKTVFSFLLQTIMWMLIGIIVIIAAPILACTTIKITTNIKQQIKEVSDTINEFTRAQKEESRAQMDGDEILRRLQEGQDNV